MHSIRRLPRIVATKLKLIEKFKHSQLLILSGLVVALVVSYQIVEDQSLELYILARATASWVLFMGTLCSDGGSKSSVRQMYKRAAVKRTSVKGSILYHVCSPSFELTTRLL